MKTSCGVLITDGKQLLVCHVTLQPQWDIPKGVMDGLEDCKATAIRECFEETGVIIKPEYLQDLGMFEYLPTKKLHLFKVTIAPLPDVRKMKCTSTFERHGRAYPEVDNFMYCPYPDLERFTSVKLFPVLKRALNL